jgi:sulfate transport system permease protein
MFAAARRSPLPGFALTLTTTLLWLGALVVLPLGALLWRAASTPLAQWLVLATDRRILSAVGLSVCGALVAAAIDTVAGLLLAWTLVRVPFRGKSLVDALVDLPFALPTAVAGIALTALVGPDTELGKFLTGIGYPVAFARPGVVLAMVFVGLPFAVRAVQPVLEGLDPELEEAAACLGASRREVAWRVLLPALRPALLSGFSMSFARAVGEYGSVTFIAGNLPGKTEIAPLLILNRLEEYDYTGATAVATLLLGVSALVLGLLALGQLRSQDNR